MDDHALGASEITVDVIGHDAATYTIVLQLPGGAIIPATITKSNFNKHMVPLFNNPPEKRPKPAYQVNIEAAQAKQAKIAIQEAKEEKPELDDICWDINDMFQEMRWHAKNNKRAIVLEERNVKPVRLAFRCKETNKSWSVDMKYLYEFLDKLFNSSNPEESARGFQLRKCVSTVEGKNRLVESINNAIQ
jgi:phage pi2 protein 07